MDLIQRLLEPRASYAPHDDFWFNPVGFNAPTNAGVPVTIDAAAQIAAVYCARSILSETLAHVPLKVNKRLERGKEVAPAHPLYRILHDKANSIQTSMEWREQQMGDLVFRGNCYSEIFTGPRGFTDELRPLEADRMRTMRLPNFRVGYSYRNENGTPISYTQDEVFHVRGYSKDGITGLAPLDAMRESLGLTIALETFGARFFRDGANHSAVFEHPGTLSPEAYERLRKDLADRSGWSSAHGTRILEEGMKLNAAQSMTAEQAQFLLSRKFQISEIARWFHVPPHLLGDLEKATFSNIEHQALEFVIYTMVPWFVRWEQRINADLIHAPQTYFAEFVVDGLLRGDIKTRYEAYKTGIETGFITRNEAREKESLNAAPGLDNFLVQQNLAMVDKNGNVIPVNKPEMTPGAPRVPQEDPEARHAADVRVAALEKELREKMEYVEHVLGASAERIMRKEGRAVAKALERHGNEPVELQKWADQFYKDQAKFVADIFRVDAAAAEKFADHQKERLLVSLKDNCAADLIREMESAGANYVLDFLKGARNGKHDTESLVSA